MVEPADSIQVLNATQLVQGQDWRLRLLHGQDHAQLVWITRGQGLMLLDGMRQGLGAHNAVFVPAGALFSMELARQSTLQAVKFPLGVPLNLPEMPRLLRIRDAQAQTELTTLIDGAAREQSGHRPLNGDALDAHAALISVWVRRQMLLDHHVPQRRDAAGRLSQRFFALLAAQYTTGQVMADYASQLKVTPTHLTRAVKAATGKTAANLIAERVLYEARRLLVETNVPAQRIAEHLGFGSAAYFTRFIRHHTGALPSKLRGTPQASA